jgi:CheY-like chemotaxis protein
MKVQASERAHIAVHGARPRLLVGLRSDDGRGVYTNRECTLMGQISVLLVEDETLVRMMMAGMIEELGHNVVAEAGNIADALKFAKTAEFGIAVLDINVGGDRIEPVAEIIDGRHLPFIFASGYGAAGLPEKFRDRPVLQKPFLIKRLGEAIEAALK